MRPERLLSAAGEHLEPSEASRARVRGMLRTRMRDGALLRAAAEACEPTARQRQLVWARVAGRLRSPAADLLAKLGVWLHPSHAQMQAVRLTLHARIADRVSSWFHVPAFRFATAVVLVAVMVRVSPLLFLAPTSSAESRVLLLTTRGTAELSIGDLWQPVAEASLELREAVRLRTGDGEATVVLHDDGNVRLDAHTDIIVRDVSDRPAPAAVTGPSLTLLSGRIWVQGLLPQSVRGITVATPQGDITVREGSVSVAADGAVQVAVWHRHASVEHDGRSTTLVAGENARLTEAPAFLVLESTDAARAAHWVSQNLDRDAVHRREIAQLQKERRTAEAGILPTSPLYPVKRIAERVDLLLTFDDDAKVKKQLAFASTRLDEAAALLAQGPGSDVSAPLAEYRTALLQVATSSGASELTKVLVQQEMEQSAAAVAAVTPSDSEYLVKKAVLEASAVLPDTELRKTDVEAIILVDTLDALTVATSSGDIVLAQETFTGLKPYLKSLKEGKIDVPPAVRKEAVAMLESFAETVHERDAALGDVDDAFLKATQEYLPPPPVAPSLTDAQIDALVAQMKVRIYSYKLTRSRWNQLLAEFRSIEEHADRGRILRALYHALPENGLAPYVRTEIQKARDTLEGQGG